MNATALNTPIGWLNIEAGDWALFAVYYTPHPYAERSDHPLLLEVTRQITAYFEGSLRTFDIPLEPAGTVWQRQVWTAVSEIAYGSSMGYSDLSIRFGSEKVRAVASAIAANPIALVIPCHRVIGSGGQLAGYAWGAHRKSWLLNHEQHCIQGSLF
jgi:methylated-DNA-[protein]-cysteine S-methyltransferase